MSQIEELLNIDTPENVQFDYEIAGIGSRFMAAFVDTLLLVTLMLMALFIAGSFLGGFVEAFTDEGNRVVLAIYLIITFVIFWGYYIFSEGLMNGQTLGKRMVGIRVIRSNGLPVSISEVLIRNLVRIVDFLPTAYGVGVISMFINPQAKRLGDFAAGTIVVFDETGVTLDTIEVSRRRLTGEITKEIYEMPVHLLSREEIYNAEEFYNRRYELTNRDQMATLLYRSLLEKMGLDPIHFDRSGSWNENKLKEIIIYWYELNDRS